MNNIVYVVIGYDEDWYSFETFKGVFSTKEKAQEFIDNDYEELSNGEKISTHEEYQIIPITIDKPFEI